jgi:hypothetical protein
MENLGTFMGMKIAVSQLLKPFQKIKLRDDVMLSDEFRAEMNQYLLDMFGTEERVIVKNNCLVMSEAALHNLKSKLVMSNFQV